MEEVLYTSGDIRITPARVVLGASTFAVANLTSVKAVVDSTGRRTGIVSTVLGVLLTGLGLYLEAKATEPDSTVVGLWVAGLFLTAIGMFKIALGVKYLVVITTGAHEQTALVNRSRDFIFEVASAINLAIMKRAALLDR